MVAFQTLQSAENRTLKSGTKYERTWSMIESKRLFLTTEICGSNPIIDLFFGGGAIITQEHLYLKLFISSMTFGRRQNAFSWLV